MCNFYKIEIIFLFLLLGNTSFIFATNAQPDSLILKIGECKSHGWSTDETNALTWTTGNQDIATVEVIWGKGTVCGVNEGITYISASSANGKVQHKLIVNVLSNSGEKAISKPEHSSVRSDNIDLDIEPTLQKIMEEKPATDIASLLSVSDNKRYLVFSGSGKPFLFLSQTLWSMPRRLAREEIIQVLDICKNQGFTAIQLIAHAHYMGPNVYGDIPFENENFLRPLITAGNEPSNPAEYDWWDNLEFIIQACVKREMFVCLLPSWREQWNQKKNLNENNAFAYGKFIGMRCRPYNPWIIWVMGGDEAPNTALKLKIHRELAKGIAWGINGREDYNNTMMTYHTYGPTSTTDFIQEDELFMDFNTIQSGHGLSNLEGMIEKAYQKQKKPVMDFEPYYTKNGLTTNEARTTIYWGIFSGGFGTSNGSWNIWHCGGRNDLAKFSIPDAFYEGFGTQIRYLGKLLSSNSMLKREPNQKLLLNNQTSGLYRILACTATDKSYAMVYTPKGESFTVDLSNIDGKKINWYWFNPRNGEIQDKGTLKNKSLSHQFVPPTRGKKFSGNDWVLVLDNEKNF